MLNVIFLDIDGVLNSSEFAERHFKETGNGLFMYDFIDPDTLDMFVDFLTKHDDIKLVISSSWRWSDCDKTISDFSELKVSPLCQFIIGCTPRLDGIRGEEIKRFLEDDSLKRCWKCKNSRKIDNFCIIDDDSDILGEQMSHFVHTTNEKGLQEEHLKQIERIFYG